MATEPVWEERYKEAMRDFMSAKGRPVDIINQDTGYFDEVSTYGWVDYDADEHIRETTCVWIVEPGAIVTEREYSQFTDTNHDNALEVGVNVYPAHCTCRAYTLVTLRYVGSLADVIQHLTGLNSDNEIQL